MTVPDSPYPDDAHETLRAALVDLAARVTALESAAQPLAAPLTEEPTIDGN